jgi:hypothetical protein
MAKNTARVVTAISPTAAHLSFAGAATFAILLAALHFIKPELDPSWHFISEYAIGDYGWIMVLALLFNPKQPTSRSIVSSSAFSGCLSASSASSPGAMR